MKKTFATIVLLACCASFAFAQARPTLGILPFTGGADGDGQAIATFISMRPELAGAFRVVPRTAALNALFAEHYVQLSGLTDSDTIARIGRQLNADYVISGNIRRLGDRNLVITTIVHVESFELVAGYYLTFPYGAIEEVHGSLPSMSRTMVNAALGRVTPRPPSLAIFPFRAPAGIDAHDAETLAQILAIEILNAGNFAILPRTSAIQTALTEMGFQGQGFTAEEGRAAVGRATNADLVLSAEAHRLGAMNAFTAQILRVSDGSLFSPGNYRPYQVLADGIDLMGELATLLTDPLGIRPPSTWASVTVGDFHTVAVGSNGTLWAWGLNDRGQLGDGTTTNRRQPVRIGAATNWVSAVAGNATSFAVFTTSGLYWELAGTGWHTVAIRRDGTLWAWGSNENGQLGDGGMEISRMTPQQIGTTTDWAYVAAGGGFTVAIRRDGSLWDWGSRSVIPAQIGTAADWAYVAAGRFHTVAIRRDGTLWTWGRNENGQLGNGTTSDHPNPSRIWVTTNWTAVAAGSDHTVAIGTDGSLWAWGRNENGQLGDGTTSDRHRPVRIGVATNWAAVSAGSNHTVAVRADGTLWAWGSNENGQLGDGTTANRLRPQQIGTATDWMSVASGVDYTAAIRSDGSLWAWGWNLFGQLGNGGGDNSLSPIRIR